MTKVSIWSHPSEQDLFHVMSMNFTVGNVKEVVGSRTQNLTTGVVYLQQPVKPHNSSDKKKVKPGSLWAPVRKSTRHKLRQE